MRNWLLCAFVAALVIAPICLQAQAIFTPEDIGLGYSFTGGAAIPISTNTSQTARPIFGIAWYGPSSDTLGTDSTIGLSADWTSVERIDGEIVNLVPVLLNYRVYGEAGGWRLSTTLGAGILAATDEILEMKLKNGVNFGWTAAVGVDVTNEFFLQFRFLASSNPGDDGIGIAQLGYRF